MPINTENPIQIIRGDKASISARTGKDGEPNWATDTHELYVHDGVTPGGHRVGGGQEVDDVTIIKDESGKLVAQDIAIGGDPTDLASARGVFNSFGTGSIDFNTLTKQGMYSVPSSGSVNGPGFACRMRVQSANGNIVTQVAVGDSQAKYRTLDSTGVWSTWREIVLADRIGDGIRVTDGILSVPEYEGATATEPGTAGLVPPATVEEKDKYLKGDGTYGTGLSSSDFESPTVDSPGKSGLVPQPQATDPRVQLANILTMKGWGSFDRAVIMPSITGDGSNTLGLGAEAIEGLNIDTLLRTGIFTANNYSGTMPDNVTGGILINLFSYSSPDSKYYGQQLLFSLGGNTWYRSNTGVGISPGGTPIWSEWHALGAPKPKAAEGVGQWVPLGTATGTGASITLPAGGVWAYFLTGASASGNINGTKAGVAGGSTVVTITDVTVPVSFVWGFCYLVA